MVAEDELWGHLALTAAEVGDVAWTYLSFLHAHEWGEVLVGRAVDGGVGEAERGLGKALQRCG